VYLQQIIFAVADFLKN